MEETLAAPAVAPSALPGAPDRRPPRTWLGPVLVLLTLIPVLLWPGDVSWLIDEPRLIANAWHANHDGQLATGGLYGNFGIRYGPLPTQIYQLLLLITHDPMALVVLRGLLCAGLTGFSLLCLGRTLRLPEWFAAAILLAPNMVGFHRILWDASFALPIGTLALAAFASFVCTRSVGALRTCLVASVLVPMIHPQGLPLFLPLAGYLLWKERAALWADRKALAALGLAVLLLHGLYLWHAVQELAGRLGGSVEKGYPNGASRWVSALAPLLGGNLLTGFDFAEAIARPPGPGWLVEATKWASRLVYPLIWLGIGITLWRAAAGQRAGAPPEPRDRVALIAVAGLAAQALIFGLMRVPAGAQYFFGTFALHALMAWIGVDWLGRRPIGAAAGAVYGTACAFITIGGMWTVHTHGYERTQWTTLSDSVAVAKALNRFSDTRAHTDVALYQRFPQPIRTVRLLLPPAPGDSQRHSGRLLITRRAADGSDAQRVALAELPPGTPPPADSQPMEVMPLPRGWVPDPSTW